MTFESPLDCKEIKLVNPKGNQPWIFIGRTDAEAEAPILWPLNMKSWLIGKDSDAGKDWRQKEKGAAEDEIASPTQWTWITSPWLMCWQADSWPLSHQCMHAKSLQSRPALCDPMDCSPPGSSVHGIFKARVLERVAMPFSNWAIREAHKYMLSYTVSIILSSDMNAFALKESKLKAKNYLYLI